MRRPAVLFLALSCGLSAQNQVSLSPTSWSSYGTSLNAQTYQDSDLHLYYPTMLLSNPCPIRSAPYNLGTLTIVENYVYAYNRQSDSFQYHCSERRAYFTFNTQPLVGKTIQSMKIKVTLTSTSRSSQDAASQAHQIQIGKVSSAGSYSPTSITNVYINWSTVPVNQQVVLESTYISSYLFSLFQNPTTILSLYNEYNSYWNASTDQTWSWSITDRIHSVVIEATVSGGRKIIIVSDQ